MKYFLEGIIFGVVIFFLCLGAYKFIEVGNDYTDAKMNVWRLEAGFTLVKVLSCEKQCIDRNLSYVQLDKKVCRCANDKQEIQNYQLVLDPDIHNEYSQTFLKQDRSETK